jgi:hypothetical protein
MTTEKRVAFLQYINTFLLTLTLGVAVMIANIVINVKKDQATVATELVRLKTVQDVNTGSITRLDNRVILLESQYDENLRNWVENYFLRKPQSK